MFVRPATIVITTTTTTNTTTTARRTFMNESRSCLQTRRTLLTVVTSCMLLDRVPELGTTD